MNREIKFRAKCKDNGDWVYGSYIANYNNNDWIVQGCDFFAVDSDTVCQFTGFHDEEGKEIYEGDIFYYVFTRIRYVVFFSNTAGRFQFAALRAFNIRSSSMHDLWINFNLHSRVIGNKYDNPELLFNN